MRTRLSTKGQLIIPKSIRDDLGWAPGTELEIEAGEGSVVVRPAPSLSIVGLDQLVGCVGYRGPRRSLEEMEKAIARGARE